jgi:hypothetical protein
MRYQLRYIRIFTCDQATTGDLFVRDTGIEPVTSSVSGKRSPAELNARAPSCPDRGPDGSGADDETRTRDPNLGKVMRYQLRYIRIFTCDQATTGDLFVRDTGIEPVTSSVSGKRSPAELNARCEVETGIEPVYTVLQTVA